MSFFSKKSIIQIALLLLLCIAFFILKKKQTISLPPQVKIESKTNVKNETNSNVDSNKLNPQVPERVLKVLTYILQHSKAPEGIVGGRIFGNRERRLPLNDPQNNRIKYQEWDVNPKISGQNRGVERLITGSDQTAYYTNDHYKTFIKIKI